MWRTPTCPRCSSRPLVHLVPGHVQALCLVPVQTPPGFLQGRPLQLGSGLVRARRRLRLRPSLAYRWAPVRADAGEASAWIEPASGRGPAEGSAVSGPVTLARTPSLQAELTRSRPPRGGARLSGRTSLGYHRWSPVLP